MKKSSVKELYIAYIMVLELVVLFVAEVFTGIFIGICEPVTLNIFFLRWPTVITKRDIVR